MILRKLEDKTQGTETASRGPSVSSLEALSFRGLWNVAELCVELGISQRTWRRMRAEGRGPSVTWVQGKQVVSGRSLEAWVGAWTEHPGKPGCVEAA